MFVPSSTDWQRDLKCQLPSASQSDRAIIPEPQGLMAEFISTEIRFSRTTAEGTSSPVVHPAGAYAPHLLVPPKNEYLGVRVVDSDGDLGKADAQSVTWELLYSGVDYSALAPGAQFNIVEGSTVVGTGTVVRRWAVPEPTFHYIFGSDIQRDGVFLELERSTGPERGPVFEIFRSDVNGHYMFSSYEPVEMPLQILEEFVAAARQRLKPTTDSGATDAEA
jgi:hypothetical protein